ncbi:MAG: YfbK domain-containing protein, partial [Pirellulaceae bacterium]
KGRVIENDHRPASNLVFLIDTSGSMNQPNKLPLLKRSLGLLLQQLNEKDRVAIVAYAGSAGLVLDSTAATHSDQILNAFAKLKAGGRTNGGRGLQLAYEVARENRIENGTNRILICTDGDFNVGQTSNDELIAMVNNESKAGTELSVLGFGMGNLNDAMLEQISGQGNGNYAMIDTFNEARKVLQDQLAGTLVTIAKDVKIQVEFNPAQVAAYRLIGYENRMLASEDFNDDKKDAGEIGAGHSVTALYEIIPTGGEIDASIASVDKLKYLQAPKPTEAANSGELLTLKLRYKLPGDDTSQLMEHTVIDSGAAFDQSDEEFQFAAAVAGFGMLLRESPHKGDWTYDSVAEIAEASIGTDSHGFRKEFVELITAAKMLAAK